MTIDEYAELSDLYSANASADGYAVGSDDDSVNEIEGIGVLIVPAVADDDVAVYLNGNVYTLVGDMHGPWAYDVPRT